MALVTFQVIDGFEKGRIFSDLVTPVTIGREEDNSLQLNDERVSRFHAKIQEDGGRLILTDLDSTNGTRVNGHSVQMRVLQSGDQVTLGRSLLVFGSAEEISRKCRDSLPGHDLATSKNDATVALPDGFDPLAPQNGANGETDPEHGRGGMESDAVAELFPQGPPELPGMLRPVQAAQLSDILAFVHEQIALVADSTKEVVAGGERQMCTEWITWQRLLNLEMQLAVYLRKIADPDL